MKLHQRAWCLSAGISTVTWTFDPLVARNAYFNLSWLGARAVEYLVDFYGRMADAINDGERTDRLLVRWDLDSPIDFPSGAERAGGYQDAVLRLRADHRGTPERSDRIGPPGVAGAPERCRVAVPADIEQLRSADPALAAAWRTAVRETLRELLISGWAVAGFDRPGLYLLVRSG